ncbi:MAG: TadE/TadG family type IV pilus assembly protein [Myxococcota bacterium]
MLLEFALTVAVLWMLVAGTIELGRMVAAGHLIQGAARTGARALALEPTPVDATFEAALEMVFDPDYLVVDVDACHALGLSVTELARGDDAAGRAGLPILNRRLLPLMIREDRELDGGLRRLLRYPGTLVRHREPPDPDDKPCATAYTVAVPELRSEGGSTAVCWHRVVEELGAGVEGPSRFSLACVSSDCGLAGLEVRYPFQSAAFPAWRDTGAVLPDGRPVHRVAAWNEGAPGERIDDAVGGGAEGCLDLAGALGADARLGVLGETTSLVDPYGGALGLGSLRVLPQIASGPSRAYRKVLTGSALYPREGFL